MQILKGNRYDVTMFLWNEQLAKAEKRLADSKECFRRFGDDDSAAWVKEDEAKVNALKTKINNIETNLRALGFKPSTEE